MLILSKLDHISSKTRRTNIISSYISTSTRYCLVCLCSESFPKLTNMKVAQKKYLSQPEYVWQVIRPQYPFICVFYIIFSVYTSERKGIKHN